MKRLFLLRVVAYFFFYIMIFAGLNLPAAIAKSEIQKAYSGKKIKIIVHYGPGGGYDTAARTLAPFIQKYTGARVIIRNITGAGGLNGMNTLWKARPNGTTIGLVSGFGAVINQMAGIKGVRFDLNKFTWLGRISPTPFAMATSATGPYKTVKDVIKSTRALKLGTVGVGNPITVSAIFTSKALGFDIKLIFGYSGTSDIYVAIARGDIDGVTTVRDSIFKGVQSGLLTPILYLNVKKSDMFPDTPSFKELNLPKDKQIYARSMSFFGQLGRLIAAPPGVKKKKAALLKKAIWQALSDPGFAAATKKLKQDLDPLPAKETSELVKNTLNAPPEIKTAIINSFRK